MKKIVAVLVAMLGSLSFLASSVQAEQLDRKVFAGSGQFQRWVNFSFEVPAGNCNNLEVYEFIRGDAFLGHSSKWQKLSPGEVTPGYGGFYRFVNSEATCSSRFSIKGEVNELQQIETASIIEVEPEDVGLFVRNFWEPANVFALPESDDYSYHLLMPNWGVNLSVGALLKDELYTSYQKLVGIILSDRRGFLKNKVWGRRAILQQANSLWVGPDDVAVLVYYERL